MTLAMDTNAATTPEETTPLIAGTKEAAAAATTNAYHHHTTSKLVETLKDGAPVDRRIALTHSSFPSKRSVTRYRHNILLRCVVVVLLLIFVGFVWREVRLRQIPKERARLIDIKIKEHAEAAAQRMEQCHSTDWISACDKLVGAGARRHRRNLQDEDATPPSLQSDQPQPAKHHSKKRRPGIELEEELLLDHDDISVMYDSSCLRIYRLSMFGDTITFPYYSNQLLRAGGSQYTMALFIQHGALRNAPDYFCSFLKLMRTQPYRPLEEILIIAPDFNYEGDDLVHPNDAVWNSTKPWGDWRVGAESDPDCCGKSGRTVSSFDVLDHMLTLLTDEKLYPNLNKISYVGHSAGGQMVQRYSVLSVLAALWDSSDDTVDMKFIVANPSSYTYLGPNRFPYNCGTCDCTSNECRCDSNCTVPTSPTELSRQRLAIPHHAQAGTDWPCYSIHYDRWPYGIGALKDEAGHSVPYSMRDGVIGTARAVRMYRRLDVVYLVGQNDTCNDGLPSCDESCWKRSNFDPLTEGQCFRNHMDTRCPAMMQGPNRRTRGHQYMRYLEWFYGEPTHRLHTIPGVGHNATAMFASEIGMRELFA